MSYFNSLTLTTKGQEMLLSSNMNIDKIITFTNASLGNEKLLPEEIKGATEIKNSWLKFPLNTVRIINDESNYFLRTEIGFTNTGITESKIMRELGIYAKFENEEEVLFAYSTTDDDGETIPKEDIVPATYKFTIDTTISTETKINQTLSPEGFLTKEVIELLKENIRNIAFRKIQRTLTANQKVIQIPTDILLPISQRAILNIEGEIYFLGRDYTIDIYANNITLNDRYNFKEGTQYEIIDPLPATYVKEQIQEFIDEFKKLVSDSKIDFDKLKDKIYLEFQEKVDSFYLELNEFIEQNKEELKGHSIDRIIENGKDENGGNIYDIFRDDNKNIGTMVAPRGPRGNGIINPEYVGLTENGDTEYVLVLEDGTKTTEKIISPKGQNGTPFYFAKTYSSIADMEADFETDNVDFGEYVAISSESIDNGKLFEKTTEGFKFLFKMSGKDGVNGITFKIYKTYSSLIAMTDDFSNPEIPIDGYVIISSDDSDNGKIYIKSKTEYKFVVKLEVVSGGGNQIKTDLPPSFSDASCVAFTNGGENQSIEGKNNIAVFAPFAFPSNMGNNMAIFGSSNFSKNILNIKNSCVFGIQNAENLTGYNTETIQPSPTSANYIFGFRNLSKLDNGEYNIFMGALNCINGKSLNRNINIGYMNSPFLGTLGGTTANENQDNIILSPFRGAYNLKKGKQNTAIGGEIVLPQECNNSTVIGYKAAVTGDNQVQLGNASTTVYAYGAIQNRSDERDKADIRDTTLGLDFLLKLKPREYKYDYRENYIDYELLNKTLDKAKKKNIDESKIFEKFNMKNVKKDGRKKGKRFHQGFIAQEIYEVMKELNVDFAGYQDHSINGGEDVKSIGYNEFIPILVKAIQEQQKQINDVSQENIKLVEKIKEINKKLTDN